jgi:ATP-dependent DNA helicase RecQ
MSDPASLVDVDRIAADVFGIQLREPQRRALTPLMAGQDTLAVLPTGSGKSAIYQVAGLALGGLTVVISPLIALQRDQLRSLADRDRSGRPALRAAMLNSGQHRDDRRAAWPKSTPAILTSCCSGLSSSTIPRRTGGS